MWHSVKLNRPDGLPFIDFSIPKIICFVTFFFDISATQTWLRVKTQMPYKIR